jgi:hypothetical protein
VKKRDAGFFFWRSTLGGALGIFLLFIYLVYKNPNDSLAIPYLPLILGFGGVLGGFIGLVIFACNRIGGVNLGLIPRAFIGILIPTFVAWYYLYVKDEKDFAGNSVSQGQILIGSLVFGAAVGLLPGILAGRERKHKEVELP